MIDPEERLLLIKDMVESDTGFEADCISMDANATEKEKSFGALLSRIYRITHPYNSSCANPHENWEEETRREIEEMMDGNVY